MLRPYRKAACAGNVYQNLLFVTLLYEMLGTRLLQYQHSIVTSMTVINDSTSELLYCTLLSPASMEQTATIDVDMSLHAIKVSLLYMFPWMLYS